jgi:nicotinamide phosphoribosyltransferase
MLPIFLKDFYKSDHLRQYPQNTTFVYSNLTPRSSRLDGIDHVVVFGIQYFLFKYLVDEFETKFFNVPKRIVLSEYKRIMDHTLGKDAFPLDHIAGLHDLGYLPVEIKALPEGSLCPLRVPVLTIKNTHPDFFWLPNFFETILSNTVWMPMTSATIAFEYRKLLHNYAEKTSDMPEFVQWQGHDFSMRGHAALESAITSGMGHLLSFTGTDTIPAIVGLEDYYFADVEKELVGGSVSATEHSVMTMGGKENEIETFERILDLYPKGVVSIVSDSWDYWNVLTNILPRLKNKIMGRDGKVVIRPDSGDPVKIICGELNNGFDVLRSPAEKGSVEVLWDLFGGTVNSKGYRQLDPHIGLIYGDSITLDRCKAICKGLRDKWFASTNMVYGIGSFTYQYNTRDTFGFAMKATAGIVDGEFVEIYKDPKTDDGTKRSAKGLLRVNEDYTLSQQVTPEEEQGGLLETVFLDGKVVKSYNLTEIRNRLLSNLGA